MPLTLSITKDKKLSTDIYNFFMLRIAGVNDETLVTEVLSLLLTLPYSKRQMIQNPVPSEWQPSTEEETQFYSLTPNLRLNTLFGRAATFTQQVLFLNVMGLTDKIEKRPDLRDAVHFFQFEKDLLDLGIENPDIRLLSERPGRIKRIHLVHPEYLDDEEISAGLHVSIRKNTEDNQVFFVCNMASLRMALGFCQENSTLIIDGHWLHGYAIDYGVWTGLDAEAISNEIQILNREFPEKIGSIRLLGCHSGKLSEKEKLIANHRPEQFIFKDEVVEGFNDLEMSKFRNRAVYISQDGETPFDENSLAAKIYEKIKTTSIRLTAPPALTYPYPSGVLISTFNIGADSDEWEQPPAWDIVQTAELPWFLKLSCLKSITVVKADEAAEEISPDTHWLRKR
jgi:hypothetical protein